MQLEPCISPYLNRHVSPRQIPLAICTFLYYLRFIVNVAGIKITNNRFRWGSCTLHNNVNFNWRLIKAPMFVIDYVIVHELAHLIEANHTHRFWNVVRAQTPTMEKAKAWLKEHGQLLEQDI